MASRTSLAPQVPRKRVTQRVSPSCRVPLGKCASAQLQQPEPLPPPFYQLLPRLKQHLIKSFSQAESVWTPGDALRALPWLGGTEMIARISQDQKSRGRYPIAHTHRDLEALGQPWLWNMGVVLGKSLLPTLSRPSQRCLFGLSCRQFSASCLSLRSWCWRPFSPGITVTRVPLPTLPALAPGTSHMCTAQIRVCQTGCLGLR